MIYDGRIINEQLSRGSKVYTLCVNPASTDAHVSKRQRLPRIINFPGISEQTLDTVVFLNISGVEFAAELRDFVKKDLRKLYPDLQDKVKITLVDGYNKILSTYDEEVRLITNICMTNSGI